MLIISFFVVLFICSIDLFFFKELTISLIFYYKALKATYKCEPLFLKEAWVILIFLCEVFFKLWECILIFYSSTLECARSDPLVFSYFVLMFVVVPVVGLLSHMILYGNLEMFTRSLEVAMFMHKI
nr:TPA_asm: hypothetical protein [Baikalogammarus pullus]